MQALRRVAERTFGNIDALVLPTAPTAYSTAQVLANPIELNSRLGTYTNFVNLLDLCGLALPSAMRPDGIPFGITLLAPAGHDAQLASIGRAFHADTGLKMGAKGLTQPPLAAPSSQLSGDEIAIAAVGAHLSGMALNGELTDARRTPAGRSLDRAGLQALCARHHAAKTRHAARRGWRGVVDQARTLGAVGGRIRKIRRRDPAAAVDRHHSSGRWPRREGIFGRTGRDHGARDISAFGGWRAFMAQKAV